jgi:hypothetical protein
MMTARQGGRSSPCSDDHRDWARNKPIRSVFRLGEHRDLEPISRAWGVPIATVVWVIVHEQLSRWRKRAPEFGEADLAIAAGVAVIRYANERTLKPLE